MNVAFFTDVKFRECDGKYYALNLNNTLWARYLKVFSSLDVYSRVVSSDKIDGLTLASSESVHIHKIENYSGFKDLLLKRRRLKKELKKIISAHEKIIIRLPSTIGLMAAAVCRKMHKEYLVEMVACPFDGYFNHGNILGKILAPFMYLSNRRCIKKSPRVLYVTDVFLQRRYPNRYINVGCSDVDLKFDAQYSCDIHTEAFDRREIRIATTGSVELKYKGQIYVLKAIKKLKRKGYCVFYTMIGGGDARRLVKYVERNGLKDCVRFTGNMPHNDVIATLANTDLYIQPSLQEGLPRALVEAMRIGCPALGSDVGGIPELLGEDCIFKRKSPRQIARKIETLTSRDLLRMSEANRRCAEKYTEENLGEKRDAFYISYRDA